jgi:hypothetical protein
LTQIDGHREADLPRSVCNGVFCQPSLHLDIWRDRRPDGAILRSESGRGLHQSPTSVTACAGPFAGRGVGAADPGPASTEFQDRAPSTRLLAGRLDADTLPTDYLPRPVTDEVAEQRQSAPLFTPIDRWGHTPFDRSALSAQSIASILAAHVAGRSPVHRPTRRRPRLNEVPEAYQPEVYPEITLDDRYYESGLEARRTAHAALSDVTATLDDIEDQADAILERLLAVLDAEV